MKAIFHFLFTLLLALANACDAKSEEWADLNMTFFYDATDVPERKPVELPNDPLCMPESLKPLSEALLVDRESKGIQNIVVFLDTKISRLDRSHFHPDLREPVESTVEVSIVDCQYSPHVFALRVGQKISLKNNDRYGHNPNFLFFSNDLESRLQPPDQMLQISPSVGEKAPTPIRCNLHPWMQAYAVVLDHPYVGISDKVGHLKIEKLPVGKELTFRIWHESLFGSLPSLKIRGESRPLTQNRIRITVKPSGSDLGGIPLPPAVFLK
jgi:hypothetical protein